MWRASDACCEWDQCTKQGLPRLIFWGKKNLKLCIIWYHINSMVIFMPEVKCNYFPRFAINLNKYVYSTIRIQLMICICGTKYIWIQIYDRSYCYGNIALLNIVIFETLTYKYWITVWLKENLNNRVLETTTVRYTLKFSR